MSPVNIGSRVVHPGAPCFVVAEIGINHNGDLDIARRLIEAAAEAGCDAVKFQKRTPELCVPSELALVPRETPWGVVTYLDYRQRIEFGVQEYQALDACCREHHILWFASCWDEPSIAFMERFAPPCYKIASACLTDDVLLRRCRQTTRPILLSTGMSTLEQIDHAVDVLGRENLVLLHTVSSYPAKVADLNLRMITRLQARYGVPIGYSGHEVGLPPSVAAVVFGACVIERHITLDRAMWGSDQAASVEPHGLVRLVRDIRVVEAAMGDGVKRIVPDEFAAMKKLRRVG